MGSKALLMTLFSLISAMHASIWELNFTAEVFHYFGLHYLGIPQTVVFENRLIFCDKYYYLKD